MILVFFLPFGTKQLGAHAHTQHTTHNTKGCAKVLLYTLPTKHLPFSLKTLIIASWGLMATLMSSRGKPESAVVMLEGFSREEPAEAVDLK